MEIKQKKFSNKTDFQFGNKQLKYKVEDSSGVISLSIDYANIPFEYDEFHEKNPWFRNAGLLWVLIGLIQGALNYMKHQKIGGLFWFFIGSICLGVFYYAKTRYTIFNTEKGKIYVIQDKQHEVIINEINMRRKKQLREYYGEINTNRDPNDELSKFQWLLDHSIIDEVEFAKIKNKMITLTEFELQQETHLLN